MQEMLGIPRPSRKQSKQSKLIKTWLNIFTQLTRKLKEDDQTAFHYVERLYDAYKQIDPDKKGLFLQNVMGIAVSFKWDSYTIDVFIDDVNKSLRTQ